MSTGGDSLFQTANPPFSLTDQLQLFFANGLVNALEYLDLIPARNTIPGGVTVAQYVRKYVDDGRGSYILVNTGCVHSILHLQREIVHFYQMLQMYGCKRNVPP